MAFFGDFFLKKSNHTEACGLRTALSPRLRFRNYSIASSAPLPAVNEMSDMSCVSIHPRVDSVR